MCHACAYVPSVCFVVSHFLLQCHPTHACPVATTVFFCVCVGRKIPMPGKGACLPMPVPTSVSSVSEYVPFVREAGEEVALPTNLPHALTYWPGMAACMPGC